MSDLKQTPDDPRLAAIREQVTAIVSLAYQVWKANERGDDASLLDARYRGAVSDAVASHKTALDQLDAARATIAELNARHESQAERIVDLLERHGKLESQLAAAREHARLLRVVADSLKDVEEKLLASDERDWVTASRMNIEKVAHALLKLPDRDGGPTP